MTRATTAPRLLINPEEEEEAYIDENYKQFNKIYTDGSKVNEPVPSVASAIYILHINRTTCWKIRCEHSIMSAELFVILQALKYVKIQLGLSTYLDHLLRVNECPSNKHLENKMAFPNASQHSEPNLGNIPIATNYQTS